MNKHKDKKLGKVNKKIGVRVKKNANKDGANEWEVTSTSTGHSCSTTASVFQNKMGTISPEAYFKNRGMRIPKLK